MTLERQQIVVLVVAEAVRADDAVGDEQVVASEMVSGASILGDGTVALVLNTSEVVRRYAVAAPLMPPAPDSKSWGASV